MQPRQRREHIRPANPASTLPSSARGSRAHPRLQAGDSCEGDRCQYAVWVARTPASGPAVRLLAIKIGADIKDQVKRLADARKRDVQRLDRHLAENNTSAAARAVKAIRDSVKLVAHPSAIGRPVADMEPEWREWLINFGGSGYRALCRHHGSTVRAQNSPVLKTAFYAPSQLRKCHAQPGIGAYSAPASSIAADPAARACCKGRLIAGASAEVELDR